MDMLIPLTRNMPLMDVAEVVALEQELAENGTSLLTLMLRAGRALSEQATTMIPEEDEVVVLCGSGNNGGDGWVCAGNLLQAGYRVTLISRDPAHAIAAQPAKMAANMVLGGITENNPNFTLLYNPDALAVEERLRNCDLIIDCILGTGFTHSKVREPYATWIHSANRARIAKGVKILSADAPSGLYAQRGVPADPCIKADVTVTMLAPKTGFKLEIARRFLGKVLIAPLGAEAGA